MSLVQRPSERRKRKKLQKRFQHVPSMAHSIRRVLVQVSECICWSKGCSRRSTCHISSCKPHIHSHSESWRKQRDAKDQKNSVYSHERNKLVASEEAHLDHTVRDVCSPRKHVGMGDCAPSKRSICLHVDWLQAVCSRFCCLCKASKDDFPQKQDPCSAQYSIAKNDHWWSGEHADLSSQRKCKVSN